MENEEFIIEIDYCCTLVFKIEDNVSFWIYVRKSSYAVWFESVRRGAIKIFDNGNFM